MAASLRSTRSVAKAAFSNRMGRLDYRLWEVYANGKREGWHSLLAAPAYGCAAAEEG